MERCIEAGMDSCLSKPVEAGPLLRMIDDMHESMAAPVVPAFDPSGVVTQLFPAATEETPAIAWDKLGDLEDLGGREFVTDLLCEYLSDSEQLLTAIGESVEAEDVVAFRSGTHALRSSGANIGATKVSEMCLHLQRIDRAEFDAKGAKHLEALREELERVRKALADRDEETRAAATR
jgi:two-component system sensor histidine kinase RpfC